VEHPDKLQAFEELLKPYGVKEAVRTGRVALRKTQPERTRVRRMRVLA
jgi:acetolactate synthase small subunit